MGGMFVRPISTHPPRAALDREGIARRDQARERGARGDGQPAHHEAVFRGVGDAVERADLPSPAAQIGRRGIRPRVGIEFDDGVELRPAQIVGRDAREILIDQADGGDVPPLERVAEIGDRRLDDGERCAHDPASVGASERRELAQAGRQ